MFRCIVFCFFKQKTAYEMRISDWSSDVCSSDLVAPPDLPCPCPAIDRFDLAVDRLRIMRGGVARRFGQLDSGLGNILPGFGDGVGQRSEEHTSELQSLMRISYAVFCLKKKNNTHSTNKQTHTN